MLLGKHDPRRLAALLLVLFLGGMLAGLAGCRSQETPAAGKVAVMASFYPLAEAARQVGGEKASVQTMIPAGVEAHDFEPTAKDIAALSQARMVVYNGAGFEPWLDRIAPDLKQKGIILVDASHSVDSLATVEEEDPTRRVPDPHFWLDPVAMQRIVLATKDAYVQVDPENSSYYEANASGYVAELQALYEKYERELAGFRNRTIVTSHAAFSYVARRYGLEIIPIAGLSPMAEPTPQELAAISRLAKERGIRYIFFETLVSPRLAETIAQEAGARTLVLNPLEGLTKPELSAGKNYISVMEDNLTNLKTALEAQNGG